jgi:hypothetical protein
MRRSNKTSLLYEISTSGTARIVDSKAVETGERERYQVFELAPCVQREARQPPCDTSQAVANHFRARAPSHKLTCSRARAQACLLRVTHASQNSSTKITCTAACLMNCVFVHIPDACILLQTGCQEESTPSRKNCQGERCHALLPGWDQRGA